MRVTIHPSPEVPERVRAASSRVMDEIWVWVIGLAVLVLMAASPLLERFAQPGPGR